MSTDDDSGLPVPHGGGSNYGDFSEALNDVYEGVNELRDSIDSVGLPTGQMQNIQDELRYLEDELEGAQGTIDDYEEGIRTYETVLRQATDSLDYVTEQLEDTEAAVEEFVDEAKSLQGYTLDVYMKLQDMEVNWDEDLHQEVNDFVDEADPANDFPPHN